jgi:hypothetical protein
MKTHNLEQFMKFLTAHIRDWRVRFYSYACRSGPGKHFLGSARQQNADGDIGHFERPAGRHSSEGAESTFRLC